MEGASGLPQQLKLEPGITREMRMCGTTQVRQTDGGTETEREKDSYRLYNNVINKMTVFSFKIKAKAVARNSP